MVVPVTVRVFPTVRSLPIVALFLVSVVVKVPLGAVILPPKDPCPSAVSDPSVVILPPVFRSSRTSAVAFMRRIRSVLVVSVSAKVPRTGEKVTSSATVS